MSSVFIAIANKAQVSFASLDGSTAAAAAGIAICSSFSSCCPCSGCCYSSGAFASAGSKEVIIMKLHMM